MFPKQNPRKPANPVPQRLLDMVKSFEGFRSKPYLCAGGEWTIGYGHTAGVGPSTKPITEQEAEALLRKTLESIGAKVDECVTVPLTDAQRDALISLVYNIGVSAFRGSTLLQRLNHGDYKAAAEQFERWVYAKGRKLPGLVKRRAAERALFECRDEA